MPSEEKFSESQVKLEKKEDMEPELEKKVEKKVSAEIKKVSAKPVKFSRADELRRIREMEKEAAELIQQKWRKKRKCRGKVGSEKEREKDAEKKKEPKSVPQKKDTTPKRKTPIPAAEKVKKSSAEKPSENSPAKKHPVSPARKRKWSASTASSQSSNKGQKATQNAQKNNAQPEVVSPPRKPPVPKFRPKVEAAGGSQQSPEKKNAASPERKSHQNQVAHRAGFQSRSPVTRRGHAMGPSPGQSPLLPSPSAQVQQQQNPAAASASPNILPRHHQTQKLFEAPTSADFRRLGGLMTAKQQPAILSPACQKPARVILEQKPLISENLSGANLGLPIPGAPATPLSAAASGKKSGGKRRMELYFKVFSGKLFGFGSAKKSSKRKQSNVKGAADAAAGQAAQNNSVQRGSVSSTCSGTSASSSSSCSSAEVCSPYGKIPSPKRKAVSTQQKVLLRTPQKAVTAPQKVAQPSVPVAQQNQNIPQKNSLSPQKPTVDANLQRQDHDEERLGLETLEEEDSGIFEETEDKGEKKKEDIRRTIVRCVRGVFFFFLVDFFF